MKRKILIVDDEVGIRLLLEDLLESEGYEVATAQTGKEALNMIELHTFDLIMIDYKLPVMDGIEVVKQLNKENKTISTILMSGLAENIKDETEGIPNLIKVLSKPFNVLEVRDYINQVLAK
jgi:two-component system, response regulator, stage 0 sporulation protein F